jgi:hypothetical protein
MHIYIHSPYSNTYTYDSNTNALCTCVLYSTAQPSTKARISPYRALIEEYKNTHYMHIDSIDSLILEPLSSQKEHKRKRVGDS